MGDAVVLLLARRGLRASEVARLRFEDIDGSSVETRMYPMALFGPTRRPGLLLSFECCMFLLTPRKSQSP